MKRRPLDPEILKRLELAERELEAGRLSRRDFNKLLALIGTSFGLTAIEMNPAYAWVATHMRKRSSSGSSSSYTAANSLRFVKNNSAYMSRTFGTPTNQYVWTFSTWIKRSIFSGSNYYDIMCSQIHNGSYMYYMDIMANNDSFTLQYGLAGSWGTNVSEVAVRRDPSAWYHLVVAVDLTQLIASERVRIFVNGERSQVTGTMPAQNSNYKFNSNGNLHTLMAEYGTSVSGFNDGYLAETHFVDGQALLGGAFGQFDATTGQWIPKQYSGAFGANGFYLPFKSNSAVNGSGTASGSYPNVTGVAGLGADYSANNNHWAGSGLATTDQMIDTPTNNFATLNPAMVHPSYLHSYAEGNLKYINTDNTSAYASFASQVMTQKTYFEVRVPDGTTGSYPHFGAAQVTTTVLGSLSGISGGSGGFGLDCSLKKLWVEGSAVYNAGSGLATNDVVGIAYDPATGRVWYSVNGTWLNSGNPAGNSNPLGTVATTPDNLVPSFISYLSKNIEINFGQGGWSGLTYDSASGGYFKYTPPSGFKALSTGNIATPAIQKPSQYFQAWTYTGNGGGQRVGAIVPATPTYTVAKSLRYTSGSSPSLARTSGTSTDAKKLTLSLWLKPGNLTSSKFLFNSGGNNAAGNLNMFLLSSGQINIFQYQTGTGYQFDAMTTETFVNGSEWHHVVLQIDTTAATNSDRIKLWVNGRAQSLVADSSQSGNLTWPTQNSSLYVSGVQYNIGTYTYSTGNYLDGLLAEYNGIDGQALDPSSFGQTDATSGDWVPKQYTGIYGTNGFYLNFSDNSNTTATTLGKDSSGNGNNWTPSGFATTDAVLDTPTNSFAVLDPLTKGATHTVTNGNLTIGGYAAFESVAATMGMSSGKWYWEYKVGGANAMMGISTIVNGAKYPGELITSYGWDCSNATMYNGASATAYGSATSTNDVVGVALNLDAGSLTLYKNNTSQGVAATGLSGTYYPVFRNTNAGGATSVANFGQGGQSGLTYDSASGGSFKYTPPSGFKALCTANLPSVASSLQIAPDLVWIKGRTGSTDHALYDTSRGVTADIVSNSTASQTTQATGLHTFTKTGFKTGSLAKLNTATSEYVAWGWKKGTTPGFDIVTFTGNGSNRTLSHSLGAVPALMMLKPTSATSNWMVYHQSLGATKVLEGINTTSAPATNAVAWNNTAPTSSVFTVGTDGNTNGSGRSMLAYLWAEVPGFSKFGTYTGNGDANGIFVWCGFRPRWILLKQTNSASYDWVIHDTARNTFNSANWNHLAANLAENENGSSVGPASNGFADVLSNGFKLRTTSTEHGNGSGSTYVFIAFAEAPFKTALAR